jgi:hypothetical protein
LKISKTKKKLVYVFVLLLGDYFQKIFDFSSLLESIRFWSGRNHFQNFLTREESSKKSVWLLISASEVNCGTLFWSSVHVESLSLFCHISSCVILGLSFFSSAVYKSRPRKRHSENMSIVSRFLSYNGNTADSYPFCVGREG